MNKKYILALDQGTTSSRAIVFDQTGSIISTAQREFSQKFPQPGWVEHDADEIWSVQTSVAAEAVAKGKIEPRSIAAIGITNQRETTVLWERATGKLIYNAIVWQDRRTTDFCEELKRDGKDKLIRGKTGLIVDAYFSATKIKWILDNVAGARERAERGEVCFGTIDSWLLWNLTGGKIHATDVSNASRTMLCDIHTLRWDDELLKLFNIPKSILPEIRSNSEIFGYAKNVFGDAQIPIAGIAGDQQAALFGQMCVQSGMVKNTYGTGCFMLMNTGAQTIESKNNLLTTVAWKIGGATTYALEGSVFIGGAVVQWLRDGLGIIENSSDVETLAAQVSDSGGVYIVPAFTGLGTPYWNGNARGTMVGLTRGSTAAHIARAALDSIAFQSMDVLKAMQADAGIAIRELRVDGGGSVNDALMQFQADILNTNVVRPNITETTALGAAYLAGLAVEFWKSIEEIQSQWQINRTFAPDTDDEKRARLAREWTRAVGAARAWASE